MSHKKKTTQSKTDSRYTGKSSDSYTDRAGDNWSDKSGNKSYTDKSDCDSQNYSD